MEKNSQQGPDVLKLVHRGGLVEMHKNPITAADVMKQNPRHCVTRPDVFRFPWIVVRPDAVLKPGNVFFVVPNHTMTRLLKQRKLGSFQEEQQLAAATASSSSSPSSVLEEDVPLRTRERKRGLFGFWGDHKDRKGGIKSRFGLGKEGRRSTTSSPRAGRSSQDDHREGGIRLGKFSFGRRSSSGEAPPDHLHQFVERESCKPARGRAKVDCRFEEDGIFPECVVGRRINNSQYFDKTSFPKSPMPCKGYEYNASEITNSQHHSYFRSQSFGFGYESDASSSPEGLYGDQMTWFSLSIPTGESVIHDGMRLDIRNGPEVDRITLKSCLKKDKLRRGVRVKFCRPGEDERKLRVEVFEFEP